MIAVVLKCLILNIKSFVFFNNIIVMMADNIDDKLVEIITQYLPTIFIKIKLEIMLNTSEKILIFKGF